jgi:hypothetical protein
MKTITTYLLTTPDFNHPTTNQSEYATFKEALQALNEFVINHPGTHSHFFGLGASITPKQNQSINSQ